jgi:hypothetical protein
MVCPSMPRPRLHPLLARLAIFATAWCALGSSCQQQQPQAPQSMTVSGIWQAHLGTEERPELFADLANQGFRLLDVSGYSVKGEARYASVWVFGDGRGWQELHGVDADTLAKTNASHAQAGLTLAHVSGFDTSKGPRFAAIWEPGAQPGTPPPTLRLGLTAEELGEVELAQAKEPVRLVDVSAWVEHDGPRFAAIWTALPEGLPRTELKLGLDTAGVDAAIADASAAGARVVRLGGYEVDGETRFYLLLVVAPGPLWMARRDLTPQTYQTTLEDMVQVGYRISHLAAYTVKGEARYAAVWTQ